MKQLGLKYFTDTNLTTFGLLLFFVCFLGICLWAFRKNSTKVYKYMETIPLQDGE